MIIDLTKSLNDFTQETRDKRLYIKKLPLITVGEFTSGDGTQVNFTEDFLKASAVYNNAQYPNRVPYLILGHIDETLALMADYVFGDVREFSFEEGVLYANALIFKEKEAEVESGKLQGVSVRINMESGEIMHVAFVGRQAIPKANLNNAKLERFEEFKGGFMPKDITTEGVELKQKPDNTLDFEQQLADLKRQNEELKSKDAKNAEAIQALMDENRKTKMESFIEKKVNDGNILPAQEESVRKLYGAKTVDEAIEAFQSFIEINKMVNFADPLKGTDDVLTGEAPEFSEEQLTDIIENVRKEINR
jgi:hypothetical protein